MLNFLQKYQSDFILVLSGFCAAITFFGVFSKASRIKKISFFLMGFDSVLLLIADHYAYEFRGDVSTLGYWMVRICNFAVFFMIIGVMHAFNMYLTDLCLNEVKLITAPKRLKAVEFLAFIGELSVVVSQFTDFYYTFDENNYYQRQDGFLFSYIAPLLICILQLSVVIKYHKKFNNLLFISMILFTIVPLIASVVQIFIYGVSLINISIVGLVMILRIFEVKSTNMTIELANNREKSLMKEEQENMRSMIEETAYALAEAVEAKDKYTHGHSSRVAEYSEMIAIQLGKDERECRNIYLAGLLHDVGKIGIPENIINKDSKLTDEEYNVIKTHPVIGNQILKKIKKNPDLSIGAHYHHERYDGKGYPEGLAGEEIPEIARIIAVADAYDAMTSKRSYRDPLPQEVVRKEIVKGKGTQFDPEFAEIMLMLIDADSDYQMKEMTTKK